MMAPTVAVISSPKIVDSVETFSCRKSQCPTKLPTIPKIILNNTPPVLDFIITPANQPATAPNITAIKIPMMNQLFVSINIQKNHSSLFLAFN